MATTTMTSTELLTRTVTKTIASASPSSTVRAAPQGGILEGGNPTHYDLKNPIILFIIQAGIIIIFCRLLHYPLSRIRQPRVIAEVIGGILLGPSVMGRIPGFTNTIFPTASMPNLNLVANLGLILFLFLVGLEVDLRYFVSNWKVALSVGTAGMALPFGLGCAIAWGLYKEFHNEPGTVPIAFGTYMLFVGVAMAITAFPVLCRILTELKLLSTPVGVIVLSAGVSNDVVGWVLLALCVALVNAGSGLTALWVLLTCIGWVLFLVFAVRPVFMSILRRTGALHDGPSQSIVALTVMIALASAFFTGVIGVHPIFGAFLAGLICPHEGGFAIKLTEKIEDLVSALLLPLYFALSGLSTNLGLLNNGITWAYVIAILVVAFFAKFIGGTLGARLNGMVWRESFTIGALMSCKGLVELIVLNIGLQAQILSHRTFTMFVVMALATTFATTPLTSWLYPPWYQRKLEAWKRGEIEWESGKPITDESAQAYGVDVQKREASKVRNVLVYLRLDTMPTMLAFVSLFGSKTAHVVPLQHPSNTAQSGEHEAGQPSPPAVEIHGMRMVELTDRDSAVMKVSEVDEYASFDPVLNAFQILGQIFNLAVSGQVTVVPESSFADTITNTAVEESSDLVLLPWSETGSMSESQVISRSTTQNKLSSDAYTAFVANVLDLAQCSTAVFINNGFSGSLRQQPSALQRTVSHLSLRSRNRDANARSIMQRVHHIFMPFFGLGADDRVALRMVLQLAENPEVTATIVYVRSQATETQSSLSPKEAVVTTAKDAERVPGSTTGSIDYSLHRDGRDDPAAFFAAMARSLPADLAHRVVLDSTTSADPLQEALTRAQTEVAQNPRNGGDIIVLGRNVDQLRRQGAGIVQGIGCLGAAAELMVESRLKSSLLVVQAKGGHDGRASD